MSNRTIHMNESHTDGDAEREDAIDKAREKMIARLTDPAGKGEDVEAARTDEGAGVHGAAGDALEESRQRMKARLAKEGV